MSAKPKSEADHWYHSLLTEMLDVEKEDGVYARVVLTPGKSKHRVEISAELWKTVDIFGPVRLHTYKREWPHGDHNYLSGACWMAVIVVRRMYEETKPAAKREDR